jgi:hypothetical protein
VILSTTVRRHATSERPASGQDAGPMQHSPDWPEVQPSSAPRPGNKRRRKGKPDDSDESVPHPGGSEPESGSLPYVGQRTRPLFMLADGVEGDVRATIHLKRMMARPWRCGRFAKPGGPGVFDRVRPAASWHGPSGSSLPTGGPLQSVAQANIAAFFHEQPGVGAWRIPAGHWSSRLLNVFNWSMPRSLA